MADDIRDAAAGADGGGMGGNRTVYADTPEAVPTGLQRLENNDPPRSTVV